MGHIEPSEDRGSGTTAGLSQTSTVSAGKNCRPVEWSLRRPGAELRNRRLRPADVATRCGGTRMGVATRSIPARPDAAVHFLSRGRRARDSVSHPLRPWCSRCVAARDRLAD